MPPARGQSYGAVARDGPGPRYPDSPPSPWLRKPPRIARTQRGKAGAPAAGPGRHLTLVDLVCVGVGATVGSGIFVLCGLIARDRAGPATFASWAVAGAAACASGLCYAELAGKFPTAGSSYAYAYITMGELVAVVAGACLTLEFLLSASAVARSWGDKVVEYVRVTSPDWGHAGFWLGVLRVLDPGLGLNPMAFLVSAASVVLLLEGVKESKLVTNLFTVIKVGLVLFMAIGSFMLMDTSNLVPLVPPQFGLAGIFRGATSSFFGYIGFDEICCISGEAKDPAKNLPRAVIATLVIVTSLYMLAAVALTGMVPYADISGTSGFPDGFRYRGWEAAAQITALGELLTLPLVVLVTIMAQPRLTYAMAIDGLLPPIFSRVDASGNLWHGTCISGIIMAVVSLCVPFEYLDDLISAGILVAFSMTDTSVVLLRLTSPADRPRLLEKLLGCFHASSFAAGILLGHCTGVAGSAFVATMGVVLVALAGRISSACPPRASEAGAGFFETPLVPHLPLAGIFVNWYLVAQLERSGIMLLLAYVGAAVAFYFAYGFRHSVGNNFGWDHIADYEFPPGQTLSALGGGREEEGR